MQVCFATTALLALGLCPAAPLLAAGGSVIVSPQAVRPHTSVVRIDAHTGRLVRTVVVPVKPIVPKAVPAPPIDSTPKALTADALPALVDSDIQSIVEETASKYDVDPLLIHSVIQVESNYNRNAVSPKGAQGLMQLIPSTARRFGVKNSFDMKENVEAGVRYLKYLNSLYPNDLRLALAAYNAGEGAVAKYRNTIPPYRETEQYVYKVGEKYGTARRAADRKKAALKSLAAGASSEEKHPPVEMFYDNEGRLYLRTRPLPLSTTP